MTSERILERAKEDPESVVPFRRFLARHPEIVLDSGKFGDEEITLIGAAMMKFLEEEIILQNPYPELQQTLMDLMDIEEHMKENKHLRRCTCLNHHFPPSPFPTPCIISNTLLHSGTNGREFFLRGRVVPI